MSKKVEENMTNSQAKRAARKAAAQKAKKQARNEKIAGYVVTVVFFAIIAAIVTAFVYRAASKVTPSDKYSACLDSNGYIKNVTASSAIDMPDYNNIVVPVDEVAYTDEEVENDIKNQLDSHKVLNNDDSLVVADGDEVNIDYVGTVDGVEFEGGSAEAYDLVIGSGSFIPGFEEQLIGAKVQSNFDINVTFPEDYSSEDLAGKAAVFNITVNGINEAPEFNDDFVLENLGEYATSAEGYREYLKRTNLDKNLVKWLEDYYKNNSTVKSSKRSYLRNIKSTMKNDEMMNFEYTNEMYLQYFGQAFDGNFYDYVGMSETEYDKSLVELANEDYKMKLVYQAIVELEGAKADAAYYKDFITNEGRDVSEYDTMVDTYGEPYVLQMAIKEKAMEILKTKAAIQ